MSSFQIAHSPLVASSGAFFPQRRFLWQARMIRYANQYVMGFLSLRNFIVTKIAQIGTNEIHRANTENKQFKSASYQSEELS